MLHKVRSVAPLPGYKLLIQFADGASKYYDVSRLFAGYPDFSALASAPGLFGQVRVDVGGYGISWTDDLDLDASELWVNGTSAATPFDNLLALSDATQIWGLSESALRKAVEYRKLVPGMDAQKFGRQWVVTADAMMREYGPPPATS